MKHYLILGIDGKEMLGTDVYVHLDGRIRAKWKIHKAARERARQLYAVHPKINFANYYIGELKPYETKPTDSFYFYYF